MRNGNLLKENKKRKEKKRRGDTSKIGRSRLIKSRANVVVVVVVVVSRLEQLTTTTTTEMFMVELAGLEAYFWRISRCWSSQTSVKTKLPAQMEPAVCLAIKRR